MLKSKISRISVIASMIFALIFGAGNLIFPLHLGQLAGKNWQIATLGFLTTAVILPLLSLLAVAITQANGVYAASRPLGHKVALALLVLIQLTLGPLYVMPRTATVAYSVGFASFIPASWQTVGLFGFSLLYFLGVFYYAAHPNSIVNHLGKILNPIFLVLLFAMFVMFFIHPLGNASLQPASLGYIHDGFMNGFLQGYNTMDALAGMAFGVAIIAGVKSYGITEKTAIAKTVAISGVCAMVVIGVIYVGLIWLGATSLAHFPVASNGGITFAQVVQYLAGPLGQALLAVVLTLACITTAIGLAAAFAQDFGLHFKRLSYHWWLVIACTLAFILSNIGLTQLIMWATPLLSFLYPLVMALIALEICSPLFGRDWRVYRCVIIAIVPPAVGEMLAAAPSQITTLAWAKAIIAWRNSLWLGQISLGWLSFALVGAIVGSVWYWLVNKNEKNPN